MKYSLAAVSLLLSSVAAHKSHRPHNARGHHPGHVPRADNAVPPTPTGPAASGFAALSAIVSTASVLPTVALYTTFAAGATPPISGAPALPTATPDPKKYPTPDVTPPTDSAQVKAWMADVQKYLTDNKLTLPNIPVNPLDDLDDCTAGRQNTIDAQKNGWWTCGGWLRDTDIGACPTKLTWGVSFDDGPSEHTPRVLNYLHDQGDTKATFFVVGSRVYYNYQLLRAEYLLGHQISVHTWSHTALTTLSNEGIVAELAWTKEIIKDVLGVTPNTFRPPRGDMDDRVRMLAKALGLTPIQWTGHDEDEFDTDDWRIPAGQANGTSSWNEFQKLMTLAKNSIQTGFIVLEHDLWAQEVEMGVGYFLPAAIQNGFKLESVNQCLGHSPNQAYIETSNGASSGGSSASSSASASSASASASASASGSKSAASASASATGSRSVSASSASSTASQSAAAGQQPASGSIASAKVAVGAVVGAVFVGVGALLV